MSRQTVYRPTDRDPARVVSSVRIEHGVAHDQLHVWNRGGKTGVLVVNREDSAAIAELLVPLPREKEVFP